MNTYPALLLICFLNLIALCPTAQGGPTNDLFDDRLVLTGTNVTVQGDNAGAGSEAGEDIGSNTMYWFYSVWYSWTAPTSGVLHLSGSTTAGSFYMSLRAYTGTTVSALTSAPTLPDRGIPVATGDTVAIQVASIYYPVTGGEGGTGPFTLTVWLEVPAPTSLNDTFTNRFDIGATTSHFEGSIYGASSEAGEPLPAAGAQQTLWWRFIPPDNGVLTLALSAPQFAPWLTVYDGAQFASMIPITPLSGSIYSVQGGREYSIQMATGYVTGGGFTLDTRFQSSSNDMFAGSEHVEGTNFTYYGNFTAATFEPGEPPSPATNTVWVSWAAPCTGRASFTMAAAAQFQYFSVYTGPSLDQLQPVPLVGMVNNIYAFLANEGTIYHFRFSGGADNFMFTCALAPFTIPANDNFADAQVIKGGGVNFDTRPVLGATMELGEPAHMGAVPQKSIWWKWQAPLYGTCSVSVNSSLAPNPVLAVYKGKSVAALTLSAKGTNQVSFGVNGGDTYYIAGAVDTNAVGDIALYLHYSGFPDTGYHPIGGNLLQEPSWEGTGILDAQYWHWSGSLGGCVNERGGCDGGTWPALSAGTIIWQDIPTIPGHVYRIRFAYLVGGLASGCCGDGHIRVAWDASPQGVSDIPEAESGYWHWSDYFVTASNTTSRVSFESLARAVEMDAFSVVDASAPPAITTQPSSLSTPGGGTAAFLVGALGAEPLSYQWFFADTPIPGKTASRLVMSPASTSQAGAYFVTVSNAFGAVTSAVVSLFVDVSAWPTIVWQPYGDTVPAGGDYSFNVAAVGPSPLIYQWFFQGTAIAGATDQTLALTNVQPTNAGSYQVSVHNSAGTAWSLTAALVVGEANQGGGMVMFQNRVLAGGTPVDAPIFDVDGLTRLSGGSYLAQLYAGPSLELLRPVGRPRPFTTGILAGYVSPQAITLANVPPGSNFVAQVRAWDGAVAGSYEAARALGGRFGKSEILSLKASGPPQVPPPLVGLQSFSLQAGLPRFTVGTIQFVERQPHGVVVWSVTGEPGYRYLVNKPGTDFVFQPFVVVTNVTGTVTFTDTADSGSAVTFYRSRILD
jgi:hypothetical protein